MYSADLPYAEIQRLAALRSYVVPDPPQPTQLDIFTRLATRICGTPISFISLVDEDTVRCKSTIGLDLRDCPRSLSICSRAIGQPHSVMVVEDASVDERFRDTDFVHSPPHVRFYAGAPVCDHDGLALGMLCVMDTRPRTPGAGELALLQQVAGGVVSGLELYREGASSGPAGARKRGRGKAQCDPGPPATGWELMADWLAETHPECGRRITDAWVPHYVRHYPRLLERLQLLAGQTVALDISLP